jgi:hypothetical protein
MRLPFPVRWKTIAMSLTASAVMNSALDRMAGADGQIREPAREPEEINVVSREKLVIVLCNNLASASRQSLPFCRLSQSWRTSRLLRQASSAILTDEFSLKNLDLDSEPRQFFRGRDPLPLERLPRIEYLRNQD